MSEVPLYRETVDERFVSCNLFGGAMRAISWQQISTAGLTSPSVHPPKEGARSLGISYPRVPGILAAYGPSR